MADPHFSEVYGVFGATVGVGLTAGDPIFFDGTNWVLADAADNTKFAEAFIVESFRSGERGVACMGGILVDTDAPYTQGQSQYLSTTATTITVITSTRPTGAENLAQIVGFSLSTSELKLNIPPLSERTINLMFPYIVSGAPQDRDNDFFGVLLDDTAAEVGATFMCPQNLVENVISYLWWTGTGTLLDATDTYTFDVSGGVDDETTTATTDTIAAASLAVAANDIARADVSAGFDGSGLLKPGNLIGVAVKKDNEGSVGDDPIMCNVSVVYRYV